MAKKGQQKRKLDRLAHPARPAQVVQVVQVDPQAQAAQEGPPEDKGPLADKDHKDQHRVPQNLEEEGWILLQTDPRSDGGVTIL